MPFPWHWLSSVALSSSSVFGGEPGKYWIPQNANEMEIGYLEFLLSENCVIIGMRTWGARGGSYLAIGY